MLSRRNLGPGLRRGDGKLGMAYGIEPLLTSVPRLG